MRSIISLVLLSISLNVFSQRISFEDPDLTFSFKKPKNWEVFDDGYVVKLSPSVQDSANFFLTFTYFEDAQAVGFITNTASVNSSEEKEFSKTKIAGEIAKVAKELNGSKSLNSYTFMKYGQRFEITTNSSSLNSNRVFRKIIRSIRVTK